MLKGIEKTYCGKEIKTKVLKGVDLSISKGEFVCIFGESGSGKDDEFKLKYNNIRDEKTNLTCDI